MFDCHVSDTYTPVCVSVLCLIVKSVTHTTCFMVDSFSRMLLVVAEYYVGLWVDLSRNRFFLYFLGSVFSLHLTRCCKKGRFLSPLYNFSCKRLVIVISV